jgi:LysM repeat protein
MTFDLNTVHIVEVNPDSGKKTRLQNYKKMANGNPDIKPSEPKITRKIGDQLRVSGTRKIGAKDTGDGLVHGEDGRSFYYVIEDPINGDAAKLFVKQSDVWIVRSGDIYTVKDGDNLGKIAKKYYPSDNQGVNRIYDANKDVIGKDPDLIYAGQKLLIPYNTH